MLHSTEAEATARVGRPEDPLFGTFGSGLSATGEPATLVDNANGAYVYFKGLPSTFPLFVAYCYRPVPCLPKYHCRICSGFECHNHPVLIKLSCVSKWDSSYSGLVLRRSCSLPADLHGRVQAALLTLRSKGCLLRDLVRVRDRDVFTTVSRALLGEPGHTYRYLDTRLFAIPWHSEDTDVKGQNCCEPDLRAACKALWELNTFFCSDVSQLKEGDRLTQCTKGEAETIQAEEVETESKHSEDSKNSEGGDSESRQSEEGDTESKHSEEWDIESKHSEEGCSGSKQEGEWETGSRQSSEEGESSLVKPSETASVTAQSEHSEEKLPDWELRTSSKTEPVGPGTQEKPVAQLKHSLSDYHIEDKEGNVSRQGCSHPSPPQICTDVAKFNVTLLNYMDPAALSQLKEEPYYGMGKMAVGWHHDENLITRSPVAVYSYTCYDDKGNFTFIQL